jgi:hypothetical protein
VYKQFLVVSRGGEPQVQVALTVDVRDRDEVALAQVVAPGRDAIDLASRVRSSDVAPRRESRRADADDYDIALSPGPLALRPQQPIADTEYQVVSPAFYERTVHVDPELDRLVHDRGLGDRAFLIGRQHDPNTSSCRGRKMRSAASR